MHMITAGVGKGVIRMLTHLQDEMIEALGVDIVESSAKLHSEFHEDRKMAPPNLVGLPLKQTASLHNGNVMMCCRCVLLQCKPIFTVNRTLLSQWRQTTLTCARQLGDIIRY